MRALAALLALAAAPPPAPPAVPPAWEVRGVVPRASEVKAQSYVVAAGDTLTRVIAKTGASADAGFVAPAVCANADDHLVAGPRVSAQRDLVRHRAARHEQRGFGSEQLGDPLLEPADRRVLAVDVIADLGLRHRHAHRGSWSRHRIASQIDEGCHARSLAPVVRESG